eukprot:14238603-Ditylum_brightwellii.AAC.1
MKTAPDMDQNFLRGTSTGFDGMDWSWGPQFASENAVKQSSLNGIHILSLETCLSGGMASIGKPDWYGVAQEVQSTGFKSQTGAVEGEVCCHVFCDRGMQGQVDLDADGTMKKGVQVNAIESHVNLG